MSASLPLLLLLIASFASFGQNPDEPAVTWREKYFNRKPAERDLVLPLPCGGAMVFRPVAIPSSGWLHDKPVELGDSNIRRGYKEGRRVAYLAGAFTDPQESASRLYYIGKYEVTEDQYSSVVGDGCPRPTTGGALPVVNVSWFDATRFGQLYTEWLIEQMPEALPSEGDEPGYVRLPTEAEWEFAARGGMQVDEVDFVAPLFPMPDGDAEQYAWFATTATSGELQPVGLLKPNPLGIYDVLGNAAEMMFVPFRLDRRGRPHGQAGGLATRGGDILTAPSQVRTAARQEHNFFDRRTGKAKVMNTLGFRLVIAAPVIVSRDRQEEIQREWALLPNLFGEVGEEASRALAELRDVALQTNDPEHRAQLELIQRDVEQVHTKIIEARNRAIQALLRVGAFLSKRVGTDHARVASIDRIVQLAESNYQRLESRAGTDSDQQRIVANARAQLDEKLVKWTATRETVAGELSNSLSYYGDTIVNGTRDYSEKEMTSQMNLVTLELTERRNQYLLPHAMLFIEHTRQYRESGIADKEVWLREILQVEKE